MSNPNAQFVRVLFESGLLGLLFYVMSFTVPVAHFTRNLPARVQHSFILLVLLLVGCSLGVRSPAPFIYLGIFIAAFRCWSPELPTKVQATAGPPPALLRSVESAT
jgi:O-antigen ligase